MVSNVLKYLVMWNNIFTISCFFSVSELIENSEIQNP